MKNVKERTIKVFFFCPNQRLGRLLKSTNKGYTFHSQKILTLIDSRLETTQLITIQVTTSFEMSLASPVEPFMKPFFLSPSYRFRSKHGKRFSKSISKYNDQ